MKQESEIAATKLTFQPPPSQISMVPSAIRRIHAKYRLVPLSHLALLIFMTSLDDYNFNLFSYLKEPLATMRFSLP